MTALEKATRIVDLMMKNDYYSQWLGIRRLNDGIGTSELEMTVREEMVNGFGICHGGITFSFADSALAFACNSHGNKSMSIETSISHTKKVLVGDVLRTEVEEVSVSSKIGIYLINVFNQDNTKVAIFKGTVYRTGKEWEV